MSLDRILQRIDVDAQAESEAILGAARTEAARKVAFWESRGREEAEAILAAAREEAGRIRLQAGAKARLEASRRILGRRREWLGRVTATALTRLLDGEPDVHRNVLARLLDRHAGEGLTGITFSADPVGQETARRFNRPEVTVATAPPGGEPRGGVIVRRGPLLLDLSFPRLMEETADRHQAELRSALFGERG